MVFACGIRIMLRTVGKLDRLDPLGHNFYSTNMIGSDVYKTLESYQSCVSFLDRCSLVYFSSAFVYGCLEWASDSVQDIALGDKPADYLQLHFGFYPPLVRS